MPKVSERAKVLQELETPLLGEALFHAIDEVLLDFEEDDFAAPPPTPVTSPNDGFIDFLSGPLSPEEELYDEVYSRYAPMPAC